MGVGEENWCPSGILPTHEPETRVFRKNESWSVCQEKETNFHAAGSECCSTVRGGGVRGIRLFIKSCYLTSRVKTMCKL